MATSRANRENVRAKKTYARRPNRDEFEKKLDDMEARHNRMRRVAVSRNK